MGIRQLPSGRFRLQIRRAGLSVDEVFETKDAATAAMTKYLRPDLFAGTEEHIAVLLLDMGATALRALPDQAARSGQVPVILSTNAPAGTSPQLLLVPAIGGVAGMLAKGRAARPLSEQSMAAVTGEVIQSLLHPAHKEQWGFDVTKLRSLSVNVQAHDEDDVPATVKNPSPYGQFH